MLQCRLPTCTRGIFFFFPLKRLQVELKLLPGLGRKGTRVGNQDLLSQLRCWCYAVKSIAMTLCNENPASTGWSQSQHWSWHHFFSHSFLPFLCSGNKFLLHTEPIPSSHLCREVEMSFLPQPRSREKIILRSPFQHEAYFWEHSWPQSTHHALLLQHWAKSL